MSEPGQGTTACLILPRWVEKEVGAKETRSRADEPVIGTGTILVVEDDVAVRTLVTGQLSGLGYRVLEAEDGRAALTLLSEHPDIDLLFSDVGLPSGMSGPQVVRHVLSSHAGVTVLLTSGYPSRAIEHLDLKCEEIELLGKPYSRLELADAVAAAMNSS